MVSEGVSVTVCNEADGSEYACPVTTGTGKSGVCESNHALDADSTHAAELVDVDINGTISNCAGIKTVIIS